MERMEKRMLNERLDAARPFAKKIKDAESSLNQSLAMIGNLLADIPTARARFAGRIPLDTGIEAYERLATAALVTAQGYKEVVAAHGHFAEDRDHLGLRTLGMGDIHECPPKGNLETQEPHLSLVKAA
jgi:hypothetical protein